MHVKLNAPCGPDDLEIMDYINDLELESNFREELFGGYSSSAVHGTLGFDFSESSSNSSHSDDDPLKLVNSSPSISDDDPFKSIIGDGDSLGTESSGSRNSPDSFEQSLADLIDVAEGMEMPVSPDDMMSPCNSVKQERASPEVYYDNSICKSADDLWNLVLPNEENFISKKTSIGSPSTTESDYSPPISPTSITSHEYNNGIPPTAIITLTTVDQSGRKTTNTDQTRIKMGNLNQSHIEGLIRNKRKAQFNSNSLSYKISQVKKEQNEVLLGSSARNIQIQPRMNSNVKPIITMENGTPKVGIATMARPAISNSIGGQITISPRHSGFISSSQTCTMVSEKNPPSPTSMQPHLHHIAPALIPKAKNTSIAELQAYKRQERMIKNRESATQSRKRKKEYLQGIETKCSKLEEENIRLKEENLRLKRRLHSYETERTISKSSVFPSMKKSSSTALLALTFLFLFNVNPLLNIFKTSDPNLSLKNNLLKSSDGNYDLSSIEDRIESSSFSRRTLLWYTSNLGDNDVDRSNLSSTICPININATESIRIENELRDWFENRLEPRVESWSTKDSINERAKSFSSNSESKSLPRKNLRKTEKKDRALTSTTRLSQSIQTPPTDVYQYLYNHQGKVGLRTKPSSSQGLVAFSGTVEALLDSFERRNDTYYVVALSSDHILLPASAHNTSARPKMSLLVPTSRPIDGTAHIAENQLSLMQIDCEVTHTKLIRFPSEYSSPETVTNSSSETVTNSSSTRSEAAPDSSMEKESWKRKLKKASSTHSRLNKL